jgi:uncharacterized membrane protein YdjX (TVP38/TMEM64 family)
LSSTETKKPNGISWKKLIVTAAIFLVISVGIGILIQTVLRNYKIPVDISPWLAYLIIFGIALIVNVSVLPLAFAVSLLWIAAEYWNPFLIALFASVGACVGELSAYYIGYLGKKIAVPDNNPWYQKIHAWVLKYGFWAVVALSFQPIIPFEIGGFIVGTIKMPVRKFFPALVVGKFPKYLILIYLGRSLLHVLPF